MQMIPRGMVDENEWVLFFQGIRGDPRHFSILSTSLNLHMLVSHHLHPFMWFGFGLIHFALWLVGHMMRHHQHWDMGPIIVCNVLQVIEVLDLCLVDESFSTQIIC